MQIPEGGRAQTCPGNPLERLHVGSAETGRDWSSLLALPITRHAHSCPLAFPYINPSTGFSCFLQLPNPTINHWHLFRLSYGAFLTTPGHRSPQLPSVSPYRLLSIQPFALYDQ